MLPPAHPLTRDQTHTQVCALTWNRTHNLLMYGTILQPVEPPGQGILTWLCPGSSTCFQQEMRRDASSSWPEIAPWLFLLETWTESKELRRGSREARLLVCVSDTGLEDT